MSIVDAMREVYTKRSEIVEVECPEWPDADGKPQAMRFRTTLSVADTLELAEINPKTAAAKAVALFIILALDESGRRLIQPEAVANGDGWFMQAAAGMDVINIVNRANLDKIVEERNRTDVDKVPAVASKGK